ncbi:hypothetical protein ACW2Q0_29780 [Nocardia sp. R16R-3T]
MTTKTTNPNGLDVFDRIAVGLLNTVWAVTAWTVLFPMISIPLASAVLAGVLLGWPAGVVVVGISAAGIMLWRRSRPEMFERWVTRRARTRFLTWFRYRRRWVKLLTACHLSVTYDDGTLVPRLISVEVGESVDRLRVRMLAGQCPDDYENRVTHLAHAFGAQQCRATIVAPATVELTFRHRDSLAETITLPPTQVEWLWDQKEAA